jgi:drug/metabolite transporter (DMT)-like permease
VQLGVHLALIAVQFMFAGLAMAGRYVLPQVPAGVLVTLRVIGAAGVLAAINTARGGPWVRAPRDLAHLALLGFLGIVANQSLFLFGLRHTTAINATILVTTTPIFTVLGSVLIGREPPSAAKAFGIALAAAGTVYLIGPDRISLARDVALGNLLIVLGMVCYAAYFVLSKPLLRRLDALTVTTYVMLFALVGVLPIGALGLAGFDPSRVTPTTWAWTAFIVIFPTILAYLLNIWALRRVSSNMVAVYVYLQPLIAALIAPLVLRGEALTTRAALAGLAIFAGLLTVIRAERAGKEAVQPISEQAS